mmetsp:Transcript_19786/g.27631  ORF Transcript_19786/g.27631 Transcript_19786/m.27631 type:complete len:343 (+) Transcript_19786:307-1335(+)|eukprot:CAMPEP_0184487676 /NCGR_PEP_ID=MMETSP0113_2-20130426/10261_1 /TAXON_ID=91329 /ORGANISM="Norrisiella sphaerica, Strain BC52" /LENGTH=342 /DNA_ID=CAMNT_0026870049 /DNA_START=290 /DNA_END=1318 /DNA_ORIENTATION=+
MADSLKKQIDQLNEELTEMRKQRGTKNWLQIESKDRFNSLIPGIKYRKTLKGHFGKIYAMHWAKEGNGLVSASQDGKLIIWNAFTTHKLQAIMLRSSWVMTCAFSPSSQYVACGGLDNICSIYKVEDSKEPIERASKPPELREHDGYLSCCRFITDKEIVTTSGDGTCILWDIDMRQAKTHFKDHTADVMSVSIFDNLFVTGSCDQTAKVWDYRSKSTCVLDFQGCHESDINSVAFFPDGKAFATGSDNSRARLLDIRSCGQLQEYHDDKKFCCVTSVDFSITGKLLFAGYDDYHVQVWNVANGQKPDTLEQHENRVSCLGVSGDGKALCTGSWDTYLRIWA